jgi:hypothetical protein
MLLYQLIQVVQTEHIGESVKAWGQCTSHWRSVILPKWFVPLYQSLHCEGILVCFITPHPSPIRSSCNNSRMQIALIIMKDSIIGSY